eukprot:NODE_269_length_11261_cov_0.600359.p3 type:complete len:342 gc:universal NODE_269_length_11261_cov_0.600359:395-1420(+)
MGDSLGCDLCVIDLCVLKVRPFPLFCTKRGFEISPVQCYGLLYLRVMWLCHKMTDWKDKFVIKNGHSKRINVKDKGTFEMKYVNGIVEVGRPCLAFTCVPSDSESDILFKYNGVEYDLFETKMKEFEIPVFDLKCFKVVNLPLCSIREKSPESHHYSGPRNAYYFRLAYRGMQEINNGWNRETVIWGKRYGEVTVTIGNALFKWPKIGISKAGDKTLSCHGNKYIKEGFAMNDYVIRNIPETLSLNTEVTKETIRIKSNEIVAIDSETLALIGVDFDQYFAGSAVYVIKKSNEYYKFPFQSESFAKMATTVDISILKEAFDMGTHFKSPEETADHLSLVFQ